MECGATASIQPDGPGQRALSAAFLALFLVAVAGPALADEPPPVPPRKTIPADTVRIQLKWFHQFQFAGYYAAIEKGFYADEGLNVILRERDRAKGPVRSVLDGDAEYGISDSGLLSARAEGEPVVLIAQIFQHAPLALVTLKDSAISSPYEMGGKRIMLDMEGRSDIPVLTMLAESLGNLDSVRLVQHSFDFNDLIEGRVDAMTGYVTDRPFWFKQRGVSINVITPQNYGIDFYGDNLFTSEAEIRDHPDRVSRVTRATLRGWEYALDHPDEIVDLIERDYNVGLTREQLAFEARMTAMMIMAEVIPLGEVNPSRFLRVAEAYSKLGLLKIPATPAGFFYHPTPENPLRLSGEEQAWIRSHPVITLSVDDGYPPKNYRDEQGNLVGISIDYIRLLEQRLGVEIRFEGSQWSEALTKAMEHKVDGVINADLLEERKPYLNFTEVYAIYPQALVTRKDEPALATLDDFEGRTVAVKKQSSQLALLRDKYSRVELVEIDTVVEGLDLLVEGRVDGVYDDIAVLYHSISEQYLTNVKFAVVHYEPPVGYARIGLRNDEPELLTLFNKAIASITDEDRRQIQRRWMDIEIPPIRAESKTTDLVLTEEERDWLRTHPVVRVGADPNWRPIEFLDSEGKLKGISIDYLKAIEGKLGIRFAIQNGKSWPELLEMCRRGDLDMFSSMAATPERRAHLLFTRPYVSFPAVIFTQTDVPYVRSLAELEGRRVAAVEGSAVQEWLRSDYPSLTLVSAPTTQAALDDLVASRADAVVANILTAGFCISQMGFPSIKVSGETPYVYEHGMAVRDDLPMLAGILQKALDSMSEEERNDIYRRWVAVAYDHGFDYSLLWKGLAIAGLIVLVFVFWNHKLSVEVSRRTRELTVANENLTREIEERHKAEEERFRLEGQLHQARKLEALGHMAGGVAHDFNNILQAIGGYTALILEDLGGKEGRLKDFAQEVAQASDRAAALVRQLLAFSRREDLERENLDLNEVVAGMEKMVRRVIGEHIELVFTPGPEPRPTLADIGQMEQVLLNLCVNARDAMPRGGTLSVTTRNADVDGGFQKRHIDARPGRYVILSVSDTGDGIPEDIRDRVFEPFFTTKTIGRGTGLGLATVYGIVKSHEGFIDFHTELGKGTTFEVYLPAHDEGASTAPRREATPLAAGEGRGETILLAEDDAQARQLAVRILEDAGYKVLVAANGEEAIECFGSRPEEIDLALLDVVMPKKTGREVYDFIRETGAATPVLFASGHAFGILEADRLPPGSAYIQKPYRPDNLLRAIRGALKE